MKKKEIESLDNYFKTENDHWNEHTLEMVCEILKRGEFENAELPLQLFSKAIELFTEHHQHPLKGFQLFESEMDKTNLDSTQKIFVYERISKYLRYTEFDDMDLEPITGLVKSLRAKLEKENEPSRIVTRDLRECLKSFIEKEIQSLPETLKPLEPSQRLSIVCRLIPFVLPKVVSIHHTDNETRENHGW